MTEVVVRREASVVGLAPGEYERLLDRMLERIARACESARDWPDEVRLAIDAGFEFASELEADERMAFFNPALAGPAAVERRCALIESAATALERGRGLYPASLAVRETSECTLVSGVAMLASVHLLSGDDAGLERARAEAIEMVLAPYVGAGRARDLALA
jgi:hypothetical protein